MHGFCATNEKNVFSGLILAMIDARSLHGHHVCIINDRKLRVGSRLGMIYVLTKFYKIS